MTTAARIKPAGSVAIGDRVRRIALLLRVVNVGTVERAPDFVRLYLANGDTLTLGRDALVEVR